MSEQPESREIPTLYRPAWRPSVEAILAAVSATFEVDESTILECRRHGNEARLAALCLCRHLTGQRVRSTADRLGSVSAAAISKAVTRGSRRRATDRRWDQLLAQLETQLSAG